MEYTIEVDFDVFKALLARRETEAVSNNDVLRRLFNLGSTTAAPKVAPDEPPADGDWTPKGVRFPAGTEFRATFKGRTYTGIVQNGSLVVDGESYQSPSAAASAVTERPTNGWLFWECRLPGDTEWRSIEAVRTKSRLSNLTSP